MMVDRRKGSVRARLFSLFTVTHFLLREPCCVLSMLPSRKVLPVTHSAGILCKGCLGLYLWVICLLSGNVLLYILTCLKITREVGFCSGRSTGKTISVLFFPHKNIKYFFFLRHGKQLSINFFFSECPRCSFSMVRRDQESVQSSVLERQPSILGFLHV